MALMVRQVLEGNNMRYLGGKSKIRKQLAEVLESYREPDQVYFEPFVGGGWVLQEMSGKRVASDGNTALISMYKALQDGWTPPDYVSADVYKKYMATQADQDPLTAFIGLGCSFAGKWFGGYARTEGRCYAAECKRSLLKQLPKIIDVDFRYGLYTNHLPENMLVYCDPPYEGTTQYGVFKEFDNNMFWQVMREWSKNNTVLISEYQAPNDFECVAEFQSQMGLSVKSNGKESRPKRTEKLFKYKG